MEERERIEVEEEKGRGRIKEKRWEKKIYDNIFLLFSKGKVFS